MPFDIQTLAALRAGQLRVWRNSDVAILKSKLLFVFEIFERNGIDWAKCVMDGKEVTLTAGTLLIDTVEVRDAIAD